MLRELLEGLEDQVPGATSGNTMELAPRELLSGGQRPIADSGSTPPSQDLRHQEDALCLPRDTHVAINHCLFL